MSVALDELLIEWQDATRQAFDALARYKFWMFGYHAGRAVFLASLIGRNGGPRLSNQPAAPTTEADQRKANEYLAALLDSYIRAVENLGRAWQEAIERAWQEAELNPSECRALTF